MYTSHTTWDTEDRHDPSGELPAVDDQPGGSCWAGWTDGRWLDYCGCGDCDRRLRLAETAGET